MIRTGLSSRDLPDDQRHGQYEVVVPAACPGFERLVGVRGDRHAEVRQLAEPRRCFRQSLSYLQLTGLQVRRLLYRARS